jgi:hypothetical protein
MCPYRIGLILVLAAASAGLPRAWATEWVVDQTHRGASDQNTGTAQAPFKTISKGVSAARPGDTVLVKAGIYRETVEVKTSGTREKRITVKAAPGERVVVSGAEEVNGWRKCSREEVRGNPNWQNIFCAEIDWAPSALFVEEKLQRLARWPRERKTMFFAQGGDQLRLVDAENLTQPAGTWEGATLTVRNDRTTNSDTGIIARYDPEKHELIADKERRYVLEPGKDQYCIENAAAAISAPGDYAVDTRATPHRVYLWPPREGDPNALRIEASRRKTFLITWGPDVAYVTFDGLEAAYGDASGIGSYARGCHDIEILNCLTHDHKGMGIEWSRLTNGVVRHCISFRNRSQGIGIYQESRDCLIEENEVFGNYEDGIVVGWYSDNIRLVRNYVHDQWAERHPDGFQTFCDVRNLLLDSNLFFNTGQAWQANNTRDVRIVNTMWVGTHHNGLSLSPRVETAGRQFYPCTDLEFNNNTIAFIGAGVTITLHDTLRVFNSVIAPGKPGGVLGGTAAYPTDYNLLWAGGENAATFGNRTRSFAQYQESTGQDRHSRYADPRFRNAPVLYRHGDKAPWLDASRNENTRSKLYLKSLAPGEFAAGDHVEVNWDRVVRTVKEAGPGFIVIDPPLDERPPYEDFVVANWKKSTHFALDLRLADDSPGRGMGEGGKDVGSNIDIQAYMRGDLNGDGRRDLPRLPEAVK